jgi:hypothetical protein
LDGFEGLEVIQILCRSSGPGSAELASSWESTFGLTDVQVWGDTTDYMYNNFASTIGGSYPNTLVIDLDTMEIRHFAAGNAMGAASVVNGILAADHPCAE